MSDTIYKLARWALGGVFIYAGGIKLMAPRTFATLLEAYGIIPEGLLMFAAILLPALEVAAGLGLMFDIEGSLEVITGLLVLFIAILGYGIWMGLDVDCGCFGPGDPQADAFHGLRQSLYRDLVMLAGIVFIFGWRRHLAIKPLTATTIIQKIKRRTEENAAV
jgi:hypothetical protein